MDEVKEPRLQSRGQGLDSVLLATSAGMSCLSLSQDTAWTPQNKPPSASIHPCAPLPFALALTPTCRAGSLLQVPHVLEDVFFCRARACPCPAATSPSTVNAAQESHGRDSFSSPVLLSDGLWMCLPHQDGASGPVGSTLCCVGAQLSVQTPALQYGLCTLGSCIGTWTPSCHAMSS